MHTYMKNLLIVCAIFASTPIGAKTSSLQLAEHPSEQKSRDAKILNYRLWNLSIVES